MNIKTTVNIGPKNINAENTILFSDNYTSLEIKEDEREKCSFFETNNEWCLIFGNASFRSAGRKQNNINVAELVLKKFRKKPQDFLINSEGSFIMLLYSKKSHSLMTMRDFIGLKHAYYTQTKDGFCLSTTIKDVLNFRKSYGTRVDLNSLDLYLTFQYIPNPNTFFKEVFQVPLHAVVKFTNRRVSIDKVFADYSQALDKLLPPKTTDIINILTESCQEQIGLEGDRVGAFLSGGMDTSSNVAILRHFLHFKPTVFTASFAQNEYDETSYAKTVSRYFKLKHFVIPIYPSSILEIPKISSFFDSPVGDRAVVPEYVVCGEIKKSKVKYLVSGEGGDEILGFPRNLPEDGTPQNLPVSNKYLSQLYYKYSSLFQKETRELLLSRKFKNNYLEDLYIQEGNIHPFEKVLYGQWQTWLIDNVFMKDVQLCGHFSLEFVSPFISLSLMKTIRMLTPKEKMRVLQNKSLLREKMAGILPERIIHKPKHKFRVPMKEWLRGKLYRFAHDSLVSSDALILKFFDRKVVSEILIEHKNNKADNNRLIWALLFLEYWYRNKIRLL